jgi:UDP-glucose 4-epimerase
MGVFNAGSGTGTSINDILSIIESVTGRHPEVTYRPPRAFDVQRIVLDRDLARRTFGWSPTIALKESIRRVWDWQVSLSR